MYIVNRVQTQPAQTDEPDGDPDHDGLRDRALIDSKTAWCSTRLALMKLSAVATEPH